VRTTAGSYERTVIYVSGPDTLFLVRKGGLEPPCPCERSHLKAVRLPISPLPLVAEYHVAKTSSNVYLKAVRLPISPVPRVVN
jgi:hypothetical protein